MSSLLPLSLKKNSFLPRWPSYANCRGTLWPGYANCSAAASTVVCREDRVLETRSINQATLIQVTWTNALRPARRGRARPRPFCPLMIGASPRKYLATAWASSQLSWLAGRHVHMHAELVQRTARSPGRERGARDCVWSASEIPIRGTPHQFIAGHGWPARSTDRSRRAHAHARCKR